MSCLELSEHDQIIFNEMMVHPALFTHPSPQKIALLNMKNNDILREVLKHPSVKAVHLVYETPCEELRDSRIYIESLKSLMPETFDVVIHAHEITISLLADYFKLLKEGGLFVQQSNSFFKVELMKNEVCQLKNNGFNDYNIFHFPQSSGLQSVMIAIKQGNFKRLSEKIIYNKPFSTQYYNFDIHKAAMALPEFIRKENLHERESIA